MTKESELQKKIMVALSKVKTVVFRNNTGSGWIGIIISRTANTITLSDYRPLRAGLTKGGSDLIGWTKVVVTPEMVGKTIAVFTAVEVKTNSGRISNDQKNFLNVLNDSGGFAGIAKNEQESVNLVTRSL